MVRSQTAATPQSFLQCLWYFLTPQLWKQAHKAMQRPGSARWRSHPLLFVLLVMTWCAGDSLPERFETARAFYVACYPKRRRPGTTMEGWQKALARIPNSALRLVATLLRRRLQQVFAKRLLVDGFIPLGCDGSRLQCCRSQELEQHLLMAALVRPVGWMYWPMPITSVSFFSIPAPPGARPRPGLP
jgi:hypothetical protein